MAFSLPSGCAICARIPNRSHADLLPGSTQELPEAVKQLRQGAEIFSIPSSSGEWDLQCPRCGCGYQLDCESGAFEWDVQVTRLTPIRAWNKKLMDTETCQRLLNALPGDLTHANPEFRAYAAMSLAEHYQQPEAQRHDALCALLRSPDEIVRSAALHEIPASGAGPFAEILVDLLWDPAWVVHEAARYRLCPSKDPSRAASNIASCQDKLYELIATRPLTYNVIQLLLALQTLPLTVPLVPILPKLWHALRTGKLDAIGAQDVLKLLRRFVQGGPENASALLAVMDAESDEALKPEFEELRRLAAKRP